jgi:transcriptional regulator with XRE-family HTH domain
MRQGGAAVGKRKWPSTGFGERLKAVREAAGQSQQRLADAVGVAVMTVSRLERGAQEPAWPLVLAFSDALGVSTEAFRPTAASGAASQPPVEKPRRAKPLKVETGEAPPQEKKPRRKKS